MPKGVEYVLKKQCEFVGIDYNKFDFSVPNWFMKYKWTEKAQELFIEWLTEELKRDWVRKDLMRIQSNNKKLRRKAAEGWAFNYGWSFDKP